MKNVLLFVVAVATVVVAWFVVGMALETKRYKSQTSAVTQSVLESMSDTAALLKYPDAGNPTWRRRLGEQFSKIEDARSYAFSINVIPGYEKSHKYLLKALDHYVAANEYLDVAVRTIDATFVEKFSIEMSLGNDDMTLATSYLPK